MSLVRLFRRSSLILIGVALVIALTFSACGGKSDDAKSNAKAPAASTSKQASTPSGPATVKLLSCCDANIMAPAIKAFEAKNPNITVKQEVVPFDQLNDIVQQRIGAKDASIDAYFADQPRTAALASRGLLADLSSTIGPEAKGVISQSSIDASTYQGKLYSSAFWGSSHVLIYNKTLLKKAGVTPPPADPAKRWTWDQVYAAAQKAKAAGAKCGVMFEQVDRYYELEPFIVSAGGGTGLTGDNNNQADLTNPGWLKAMSFYSKLFSSGVAPRGVDAEQTKPLLTSGKCAFFVGGVDLPLVAAKTQKVGIAPYPMFAGGKAATPADSFAMGMNPYSKNQAATLAFIKFVTLDTQGALAAVKTTPTLSANQNAAKQFYATQLKGEPELAKLPQLINYELANTVVHRPVTPGYIQFETIVGQAFADIRNGKDPKAVLQKAQDQVKSAFARL